MVVKPKTRAKAWPVLQSCKQQCSEANDLLSRLPDDILLFIMSLLTMKEAARTSVLSHRWNYMWRCFPLLVFEDSSAMKRMFDRINDFESISQEKFKFVKWVNQVVEAHRGSYVDELRVTFDLSKRSQCDMDKWLVFAIAKQVKHLEFNFSPVLFGSAKCRLPKWRISLAQPQNLSFFKSHLRSLSLKFVNITTEDVDCLLRSCMILENLCIDSSPILKYIRVIDLPLPLKHLEVSWCYRLKAIDILAPKLLSFRHFGEPAELNIISASMLSKLSYGYLSGGRDIVTHLFDSLSKYFPQLEYMSLKMELSHLGIKNTPSMRNLKHLVLEVKVLSHQTLLGWADLIESSPRLERLTLKFMDNGGDHMRTIMKRNGRPLKSLKTLELYNDLGLPIDLEFVTYVVEHSIMLKDVIVELRPLVCILSKYVSVQDQVANLRQIVPQGVNFTLNILPS